MQAVHYFHALCLFYRNVKSASDDLYKTATMAADTESSEKHPAEARKPYPQDSRVRHLFYSC